MMLDDGFVKPLLAFYTFAIVLFVSFIVNILRNVYFHPLSGFPGPKLWAASRLPYVISLLKGDLVVDQMALHAKYGKVIRLAPNEISFTAEEAWKDIYVHRPGHQDPAKDPVWYKAPEEMPQNIVTATDIKNHARMRKALASSFTEKVLKSQAPIIESYAALLVAKLREMVTSAPTDNVTFDLVEWMTFFTVDVMGDLALGESFDCLESSKLHPWVKTLHNFLKGMVYAASTRWFPLVELLLMKLLPKKVMELQRQHAEFTNERINKRIGLEKQRPDFMTPYLEENAETGILDLRETQSNFAILIVAGTDAVATALSGTMLYLVQNPPKLEKLSEEIRSSYFSINDINVASTTNLPYLDAVINEGLRLTNPIPGGLPRIVPPGGDYYAGHFVPEGTSISVRPYAMSRSDEYFAEPKMFLPERWLPEKLRPEGLEFVKDDLLNVSNPFSLGHSNCLGKGLAWAEMRLVLAKLIFDFDFEETLPRLDWTKLKTLMIIQKGRIEVGMRLRAS